MTDTARTETPKKTFLTQDAYDRLQGELTELTGDGRVEIAKRIEAARLEGDLKENGGYHAAKEEQGKMELRIRQLQALLDNAEVGTAPKPDDGIVEPGMVVVVEMFGEQEKFLLGSREMTGSTKLQVFSEASPLGSAVNGKKVGDSASYETPTGKKVDVKILEAEPFRI